MRGTARSASVAVVGVDAYRENLRKASRRAPDNALYNVANALALPRELGGMASSAVAVILPGLPSPGFSAHQEAPSSAAQRSLRHASASTESLPTSSPAEGRSRTSPTACPA